MRKIVHISRILKWAAISIAIALPVIEAGYWITQGYPFLSPFFQIDLLPTLANISWSFKDLNSVQTFLCFLSDLIPIGFYITALVFLAQIFSAFQHLQLFEVSNARRLKNAGWAIVWSQIFHPVHEAMLSLILTYRNPPGKRMISIGFGTHELTLLTMGLAILLISWILAEAAKMHEEQAATI
jgi:hypothetical protein